MLGTLVQVAKEMFEYEGQIEGLSSDELRVNHLCSEPRKKGEEIKEVLFANFKDKDLHPDDYKPNERWKYLYALPTGGHGIGPSWIVDLKKKGESAKDKEVRKALNEIRNGLKNLRRWVSEADKELMESCLDEISKDSEWLVKEVLNRASGLKVLLVIQLNGKKPGELRNIREAFCKQCVLGETRAQKIGKGVCGICGAEGNMHSSLPFKFYTVEKRGFAPMAFEDQSWKYAPLCEECTQWLYIAKSFLDSHLSVRVAGKSAYLIPNLEPYVQKMPTRFTHYLWEFKKRSSGRIVPDVEGFPEERRGSGNLFEDLMENYDWNGPAPFRSASLIFHQPGRKFLFLYSTSDILPSQLKQASERLKELREDLRNDLLGEPGEKIFPRLRGNFRFISQAWSYPSQDGISPLNLNSMHLVECLLTQSPPSPAIFWSDVDKTLRRIYVEAVYGEAQQTVKEALSHRVVLFWTAWVLLYEKGNGGEAMESFEGIKLPQDFWENFFRGKKVLDGNAKRGVFLLGVLFGEVEYRQRKKREDWKGEMPILSSLRGLTISAEELKRHLSPQLLIKLRQLSACSMAISEAEAAASYYLSSAEDTPDEEARFAFCLGWALSRHTISSIREALPSKEKEIEEEE